VRDAAPTKLVKLVDLDTARGLAGRAAPASPRCYDVLGVGGSDERHEGLRRARETRDAPGVRLLAGASRDSPWSQGAQVPGRQKTWAVGISAESRRRLGRRCAAVSRAAHHVARCCPRSDTEEIALKGRGIDGRAIHEAFASSASAEWEGFTSHEVPLPSGQSVPHVGPSRLDTRPPERAMTRVCARPDLQDDRPPSPPNHPTREDVLVAPHGRT